MELLEKFSEECGQISPFGGVWSNISFRRSVVKYLLGAEFDGLIADVKEFNRLPSAHHAVCGDDHLICAPRIQVRGCLGFRVKG